MKKCSKCKEEKAFTCFYKDGGTKDGYNYQCKDCRRQTEKAYAEKNPEKVKEKNRRYHEEHREEILERKREWRQTEHGKKICRKNSSDWKKKNRWKNEAHGAVERAINKGELVRPSECSICGATSRIEGHHEDYNDKLNVVWLCNTCHAEANRLRQESGKEEEQLSLWLEAERFKNSEEELERKKQEKIERRRARDRDNYHKDPEKFLARNQKYRQGKVATPEGREEKRKKALEYYHENSERLNAKARERYAKKMNKE